MSINQTNNLSPKEIIEKISNSLGLSKSTLSALLEMSQSSLTFLESLSPEEFFMVEKSKRVLALNGIISLAQSMNIPNDHLMYLLNESIGSGPFKGSSFSVEIIENPELFMLYHNEHVSIIKQFIADLACDE